MATIKAGYERWYSTENNGFAAYLHDGDTVTVTDSYLENGLFVIYVVEHDGAAGHIPQQFIKLSKQENAR